jgi:SAM-dependent methyltransferase
LSDGFGFDRGTPIDRYYIESFLEENRAAIRGRVLEVKDSKYTQRFGGDVVTRDVLDVDPTNRNATMVADLAAAESVPAETFDCFVLTQTLQYIFDARSAISHAHRILRPGGILLCTVPAISRIERGFLDSEYWRFTPASCRQLFGTAFGPANVTVRTYGNVLAAIAFLMGMASEELRRRELADHDEFFPVIVAIRARKDARRLPG